MRWTTLKRSQQFKRSQDNAVFHQGYPTNYREQGGIPSVQISIALDGRRADVDVDYRSPTFPIGLFNGHLSSSNSDVRAGNNYDRHLDKWTGFQNWWRSFFGVHQENAPEAADVLSAGAAEDATHRPQADRRHGQRLPAGVAHRTRRRRGDGLHL